MTKFHGKLKKSIVVKHEFSRKIHFYCCAEFQKMNRFQEKLVTHVQKNGHRNPRKMDESHEFIAIHYLSKLSIIQVGKHLFKVSF